VPPPATGQPRECHRLARVIVTLAATLVAAALSGEFALTADGIGLKGEGPFSVTQEHPAAGPAQTARTGETIRWEVPAQSAVVLRIRPDKSKLTDP